MDRKPTDPIRRIKQISEDGESPATPRRIDRLAEVVDLCTEARRLADALDEKLLSYLLAMAIQETRSGMRQQVETAAAAVQAAPRRAARKRR